MRANLWSEGLPSQCRALWFNWAGPRKSYLCQKDKESKSVIDDWFSGTFVSLHLAVSELFMDILRCFCVVGKRPQHQNDLWETYQSERWVKHRGTACEKKCGHQKCQACLVPSALNVNDEHPTPAYIVSISCWAVWNIQLKCRYLWANTLVKIKEFFLVSATLFCTWTIQHVDCKSRNATRKIGPRLLS